MTKLPAWSALASIARRSQCAGRTPSLPSGSSSTARIVGESHDPLPTPFWRRSWSIVDPDLRQKRWGCGFGGGEGPAVVGLAGGAAFDVVHHHEALRQLVARELGAE